MADKFTVDGDAVRALAQLLTETNLTEVEYQVGTHRVKVKRQPEGTAVVHPAPQSVSTAPAVSAAPAPQASTESAPQPAAVNGETITSPMVGTAYLQPEPGSDPFVSVGATVNAGDTLLIVEAMKVMNPIKAPRAGKVVQILVADGAPLEFGEPLIVLQ